MERLSSLDEVSAASNDDAFARWAAQRLDASGAAYAYGGAIAVVAPALFHRDRLVVRGEPDAATELIRHLAPALPDTYRVLGAAPVLHAAVDDLPGLELLGEFDWMETTTPAPSAPVSADWLSDDAIPEAAALMARASPGSWAVPGQPAARRWAGVRDDASRLVALAADAWSGGGVGFVAGVATDPEARGSGLGRAVTAVVTNALLDDYGRAALMVDRANEAAIGLYRRLGYAGETIVAARYR